jgi:uncharacterized membrane protein
VSGMTETNTDGSVASPLLLDSTRPRGEPAVHPTCPVCGEVALLSLPTVVFPVAVVGELAAGAYYRAEDVRRLLAGGACECPAQAQELVKQMMEDAPMPTAETKAAMQEAREIAAALGVNGLDGSDAK